jgi:hypothetical protein
LLSLSAAAATHNVVEFSSPEFNCLFDSSCTVIVTDSVSGCGCLLGTGGPAGLIHSSRTSRVAGSSRE